MRTFVPDGPTWIPTLLDTFGAISGYKVNYDKSEIMPLRGMDSLDRTQMGPFKWSPWGFKCLGITISRDLKDLFKLNYSVILKHIEEDLNVLSRILYLFQSLPISAPKSFFMVLNKSIRRFIWKCKPARVNMMKLTWDLGKGGLNLPDVYMYYLAAQVRFISSLVEDTPSWAQF